jgi:hypothetical protein
METGKKFVQTETEKQMKEFIKQNADLLYKKESQELGARVNEGNKDARRAVDGKFTKVK